MATRQWDGSTNGYSSASDWSPTGTPQVGDVAIINRGMMNIGRSDLASSIRLQLAPTNAPLQVSLQNTAILPSDEVDILAGKNPAGVRFALLGSVVNFGTINTQADGNGVAASSDLAIGTLNGGGGLFYNFGRMTLANGSSTIMSSDGGAGDGLVNDGVIETVRPGSDLVVVNLQLPVSGTGLIEIGAGSIVTMQSVGVGQTVSFDQPGSLYSQLTIGSNANFAGLIAGFGANDSMQVNTVAYDSRQLSFSNGVTTVAFLASGTVVYSLRLQGSYTQSQLIFSSYTGSFGIEATTIRGAIGTSSISAEPSTTPNVFRFFDTASGTHFFTDDPNEAATVSSARPDLVIEGVGFDAVDPAIKDPNAAAVYRFFDQTDGTHFFTASGSEKANIIATRPDLIFEPNSTFYEHTTAQAADAPVYRFFDSVHGTHFYTASSVEQAGIVNTRADLVSEGIAFYAPARPS